MCWLGFLYGLLVMGVILAVGWFFEWLDQQRWKGTMTTGEGPLLSELDLLRIAQVYEGHKDIDLMIREIRRCWR